MDKVVIKNFSIAARRQLIQLVMDKAMLIGVTKDGIGEPEAFSTKDIQYFIYRGGKTPYSLDRKGIEQRKALIDAIRRKEKYGDKYEVIYESIIEEVAYTWFNRLIAIRFMEVNGFLPSGVRVLSGEDGKAEPEMVSRPFEMGMQFTEEERKTVLELISKNKQDDLFGMLFIKQCNTLNLILPGLFEKTNDYTELLLNIKFTDTDGVVSKLINDIPEKDFIEAVEIVGWLYQFYNTEPKDEVFEALRKKNEKISKEKIPAATQLFTPDWIVKYMVENSLGRLWLEGHPDDILKSKWKYYQDEDVQTPEVAEQLKIIRVDRKNLTPEEITFLDPCMGSGHILLYAFEVLMQIYESVGYMQKDAVRSILQKNLFGLDIDKRAYQLAYFALMMCARKYNKRFFESDVSPQVYYPQGYREGENYGSLIKQINENMIGDMPEYRKNNIEDYAKHDADLRIWNFKRLLTTKYDVVCTNPPYMGGSGMNPLLSVFVKTYYPDSKTDLYAVFIERCIEFTKQKKFVAMITQQSWMTLTSYEELRKKILHSMTILNMAHLGPGAFAEIGGEVVQPTAFILLRDKLPFYSGMYSKLDESKSPEDKERSFLSKNNLYYSNSTKFMRIPGCLFVYDMSDKVAEAFQNGRQIGEQFPVKKGMDTGDNAIFIRLWHEVSLTDFSLGAKNKGCKWYPYDKGGEYRKWYGNKEYVINFENDGEELSKSSANLRSKQLYFKNHITWNALASKRTCFRYSDYQSIFDSAGSSMFPNNNEMYYLGLMNSVVAQTILKMINPTLNYGSGSVSLFPAITERIDCVEKNVADNVSISKVDWDSFETSWDFKKHPLLNHSLVEKNALGSITVESAFRMWEQKAEERFNKLKLNEEEINRIFIDIYNLRDELTPNVDDKDVTISKADIHRDIRSFVSYAVGCMFGRYSIDTEGLSYAGGEWDPSKYSRFAPDIDNIIPITDEGYYKEDIVTRFVEFVSVVFGKNTIEGNLDFFAKALGTNGNTSREIIRNYFLKEFYKDHLKTYQKCPIYWLFDSGEDNGFKALIYIHRYNIDTIGKLRVDYLNRLQEIYDKEADRMRKMIDMSTNSKDISDARKRLEKLTKQILETRDYDSSIGHLALARISLDPDDGVKVNYEKLQTVDGKKYEVLGKI